MTGVPRVVRNDWSGLRVPRIGEWRPTLPVSVIIPAYQCQASLDLTLAALIRQTYPSSLLEVVVVDDGSRPPLVLPDVRPENSRIVWVGKDWGIANACDVGVRQSSGTVIQRLDADMVVHPEHVEAHARWHHQAPYAVTLGAKRFVDVRPGGPGWPSAAQVAGSGSLDEVFADAGSEPHDYIERMLGRTDQLRGADHLGCMAHVGATVALRRELYDAAGGYDPRLRRGSDTEFGYRLAQAGALFIPEPEARSWHLGPSGMIRHTEALQRYSRPFLADLMPHPRWLRRTGGTAWAVPLVEAVVDARGRPLELVRAVVDAILRGDETDVRVNLVGDWDVIGGERMAVLADPHLDLRLIEATYRSDPRVRLVDAAPATGFPAPYLLTVPAYAGLAPAAITRMIDAADRQQAGVVRVPVPGPADAAVELWRTAALGRAGWVRRDGEPLSDAVSQVAGVHTLSPHDVGVADLSALSAGRLAQGIDGLVGTGGRWLPAAVEVAGFRSWLRATALVGRMSVARAGEVGRRGVRRLVGGAPRRAGRRGGDQA